KPIRLDAGTVQADLETHVPHLGHGRIQGRLLGGFATAEHHRLQQADAPSQKRAHLAPFNGRGATSRYQLRVMTVATAPAATLAEQYAGQMAGKVEGGQGDPPPDPERCAHAERPRAADSVKWRRSRCSDGLPGLKADTGRW